MLLFSSDDLSQGCFILWLYPCFGVEFRLLAHIQGFISVTEVFGPSELSTWCSLKPGRDGELELQKISA